MEGNKKSITQARLTRMWRKILLPLQPQLRKSLHTLIFIPSWQCLIFQCGTKLPPFPLDFCDGPLPKVIPTKASPLGPKRTGLQSYVTLSLGDFIFFFSAN